MASPSLPAFIARWQKSTLTERSAAQSHFIDLCRLLDQPTPVEADPTGEWYAFEKGVTKSTGGEGFADVWMKGRFAWEYKGKRLTPDDGSFTTQDGDPFGQLPRGTFWPPLSACLRGRLRPSGLTGSR